ncbi:NAD-dependent protein deacylase [Abyssisolibacter fermentans]|uniref:NAD-dependent protein deacylase n=1 Tax=Abyssisolibacter fermentans TaxID=1766203 RepID=UPI000834006D|nr:NAD-dependent protein deacylase [Abyssisolibacter fermentans]
MSIQALVEMIRESDNIVFFGGAGTSTESNIPDFRSEEGLYQAKQKYKYSPETMLSHTFFKRNTEEFYRFYKESMIYKNAMPNDGHKALVDLEKLGKLKAVITQNIDGLHQLAGNKEVLELHGSIHRNYCTKCKEFYDLNSILNSKEVIPTCKKCGSIIKPDVTLYEEALKNEILSKAVNYISEADMLIVAGTSLVVYPAAGLINYYKGNKLVLINKQVTPYDSKANLVINDSIGKILKNVVLTL